MCGCVGLKIIVIPSQFVKNPINSPEVGRILLSISYLISNDLLILYWGWGPKFDLDVCLVLAQAATIRTLY